MHAPSCAVGAVIGPLYAIMAPFRDGVGALKRPEAPPVCPKCGSHRTEVIGKTDAKKNIVRCNACGSISHAGNAA